MLYKSSKAMDNLFYRYTHLPIGGKEIICPYFLNKIREGVIGPFGGKGTPEQIVQATNEEAEKNGIDLNLLRSEEIIKFMVEKRIGVDCSGFVFWVLDALDKERGGNGIADDIPDCKGKILECRANVSMLTDENITRPITLSEIEIGDMIRLRCGKHIAVVTGINREEKTHEVKEIIYCHSSQMTDVGGVHESSILIINPKMGLEDQAWEEKNHKGENYGVFEYFPKEGDGLKRFRIW